MARSVPPAADRRRTIALATAAGCALGARRRRGARARGPATGRDRDDAMLHGFTGLAADASTTSRSGSSPSSPTPCRTRCVGLVCIAVALARRRRCAGAGRRRRAGGLRVRRRTRSSTCSPQPRYVDWLGYGDQIDDASWPSGHGTAAMTLALCAVIVAPPAWRAVDRAGRLRVRVGLAYATLALTWHYPSDVFGGFLVAGLWVSLASWPARSRPTIRSRSPCRHSAGSSPRASPARSSPPRRSGWRLSASRDRPGRSRDARSPARSRSPHSRWRSCSATIVAASETTRPGRDALGAPRRARPRAPSRA